MGRGRSSGQRRPYFLPGAVAPAAGPEGAPPNVLSMTRSLASGPGQRGHGASAATGLPAIFMRRLRSEQLHLLALRPGPSVLLGAVPSGGSSPIAARGGSALSGDADRAPSWRASPASVSGAAGSAAKSDASELPTTAAVGQSVGMLSTHFFCRPVFWCRLRPSSLLDLRMRVQASDPQRLLARSATALGAPRRAR